MPNPTEERRVAADEIGTRVLRRMDLPDFHAISMAIEPSLYIRCGARRPEPGAPDIGASRAGSEQ
jgi:hypothetical protein